MVPPPAGAPQLFDLDPRPNVSASTIEGGHIAPGESSVRDQ